MIENFLAFVLGAAIGYAFGHKSVPAAVEAVRAKWSSPPLEVARCTFVDDKIHDAIIELTDGRTFRGAMRAWDSFPDGHRAPFNLEPKLEVLWQREVWRREGKAG